MFEKRLLVLAITCIIGMSNGYSYAHDANAQAMADRYRELAQSYQKLAEQYQRQADMQQPLDNSPSIKASQVKDIDDVKVSASKNSTKEHKALSPWEQENKVGNDDELSAAQKVNSQSKGTPASSEVEPLSPWGEKHEGSDVQTKSKTPQAKQKASSTTKALSPWDAKAKDDVQASEYAHSQKEQGALTELNLPKGIAEDKTEQQKKPNIAVAEPWKGTNVDMGGSIVTGNSAATNYNGNANIAYNPIIPWSNTLNLSYLYNRDDTPGGDGVKTDKFQAIGQTNWKFNEYNGVYASLDYARDVLESYDYTLIESVGYLRRLYANETMTLDGTVGPSMTQQKTTDTAVFSNAFGLSSSLKYTWNITDATSFTQDVRVNYTPDDSTIYQTNSALNLTLYKNLQFQIRFKTDGSSWADTDKRRVNTTTSTNLVYNF